MEPSLAAEDHDLSMYPRDEAALDPGASDRHPAVVLIDDHALFRESLRVALAATHGMRVVGECGSVRETIELLAKVRPQVLVADLMLADSDAVSLLRELRRLRREVPTLIVSRLEHAWFVQDALDAGAQGYGLKDDPFEELVKGIRAVARGEHYLSPGIDAGALTAVPRVPLSQREREVFYRLLDGATSKDIARALCVSVKTVHTHRLQINRKLGVHSPAEFASLTAGAGLYRR